MVVNNVDDHSDTSLVALVDELLVLLACTISLVKSEIVVRVVSPACISVELLDRHELNCVHSKSLEVVKLSHRTLDVVSRCEVTEEHLVDYRAILVLHLEWSPSEVVTVDLHTSNCTRSSHITRVNHLILRVDSIVIVDPLVVIWIENLLCERI